MAVLSTVVGTGLDTIIQHTYDYTYISQDLKDYATNYTPEIVYPIQIYEITPPEVGTPPFTFSVVSSSHGTLTSIGHAGHSYLEDFYYRFHFSTYNLSLGPILSEQHRTLSIWNAWFTDVILTDITEVSIGDITLNLGATLPKTFKPLENLDSELVISATGQPVENGYYTFTFDTQTVVVYISGIRAAIFPFAPQIGYRETKEWKTNILKTKTAESRFIIREYPRVTYEYSYKFRTPHEYSMARLAADNISEHAIALPVWDQVIFLGSVSIGTTVLLCDTQFLELEATNATVIIFETYEIYEILEVSTFDSTSITLKTATTIAFTNCWVTIVKSGYTTSSISFTRNPRDVTANISMLTTNGYYEPIWSSPELYLTLPILDTIPIATGGLENSHIIETETFDSDIGNLIKFNLENSVKQTEMLRFAAHTREDKYNLHRFLDYFQGKYAEFWLPTFNKDLVALENVTAADATLQVQYANWQLYPGTYIRIIGSITRNFQVIAVADGVGNTEILTLSPTPTENIQSIVSIQILLKVRLNSDRITYDYDKGANMFVNIPVIEVP